MKNKISYLVLGAFLMVGAMDGALAAQAPVSAYVTAGSFDRVHAYAHNANALVAAVQRGNLVAPANGALQEAQTGIGIGLNGVAFGNAYALADVFGAGVLQAAGGNIGAGQHVFQVGFRPGALGAVATSQQGCDLLNEISRDFYATFDMKKFSEDLLFDYVGWLGEHLKGNKLSGADIVAIGDLTDSTKLLGVAERNFQDFLGQYNVKDIVKTHFKDLFERKLGEAVRKSANAANIGLDEMALDLLIARSRLCVYKGVGNWNQNLKDAFVAAVEAIKKLEFTNPGENPLEQIKQNLMDRAAAGVESAASRFAGAKTKTTPPAPVDNNTQQGGNNGTNNSQLNQGGLVTVTFGGKTTTMTKEQAAAFNDLSKVQKSAESRKWN